MHRTTPRRLLLLALGGALALPALPASPAQAASDCTFDPATATLAVRVSGTGTSARLSRTPTGAIAVDGVACGLATTRTVDTIAVTGGEGIQQLVVDHSGGLLAPGKTPEPGQTSEIEVQVDLGTGGEWPVGEEVRVKGAPGNDYVRFGGKAAFLTADADADLTTTNVERFAADGGAGTDRLLGTGDGAGGPASALPLQLAGGDGADTLAGGAHDDVIEGGAGSDVETGHDGRDTFREGPAANGRDSLDGGGGPFDVIDYSQRTEGVRIDLDGVADDGATGELDNVKDAVEYLHGGAGADTIVASQTRYSTFEIHAGAGDDRVTGGSNYDYLWGDGGDDTLLGLAGSDTFVGGAGDDRQVGDTGGDVFTEDESEGGRANGADDLSGGPGVDAYDASARTTGVWVMLDDLPDDGAPGERDNVRADVDNVHTGRGADVVVGSDVPNYVSTGAGADTVDGGAGDDRLWGREGEDRLGGSAGRDNVNGGEDADRVDGGDDDDRVSGEGGDDTVRGGPGTDRVYGEMGDDRLVEPQTKDPGDTLDGGHGTDGLSYAARSEAVEVSLLGVRDDGEPGELDQALDIENATGGAGPDVLQGSHDASVLDGALGADHLKGGGGDDRLIGGAGPDRLEGGDGPRDVTDYSAETAPLTVTLGGIGDADDGAAGERDHVDTEDVIGGRGDDRLTGDGFANVLDGGAGDDTLDGGGAGDVFEGGADTDTVSYARSTAGVSVTLDGAANDGAGEKDNVTGSVEHVLGGSGSDALTGDARANVLRGGTGDDRLDGGAGADVLDGQEGRDTADYGARTAAVSVTPDGRADDGEAGEGDDVAAEILQGGAGPDRLTGGPAAEELRGGKGDDRLQGGEGGDVLAGGEDTDTVTYAERGAGDPVQVALDGVADDGRRDGTEHDDVQPDVEHLVGGAGDDVLTGDDDANVLSGGPAGRDTLYGEGGDDRLDESADPADPAADQDALWGGGGTDVADYTGRTAGLRLSLDEIANDGALPSGDRPAEGDNVHADVESLLGGTAGDLLSGSPQVNRIEGGPGTDAITGGGGDDDLRGGDAADRVNAGTGDDRIEGGAGNNILIGENGDDVIVETPTAGGGDQFIGGGGHDTLDYSARTVSVAADNDGATDDGQDADRDGTAEEKDRVAADIEVMKGGGGADRLTQSQPLIAWCEPALHGGGGDDVLTGQDVPENLYGGAGSDTLRAAGGNDFLLGGPGGDLEEGGEGEDHFVQGAGTVPCEQERFVPEPIEGRDGADRLDGGASDWDKVTYARTAGARLWISLNGAADDGAAGEGDAVSVEHVDSGASDDVIVGNGLRNRLHPGHGDDRVFAGDGPDEIWDIHGMDEVHGDGGIDTIIVRDRDDADTINGGPANDNGAWDDGDTTVDM